MHFFGGSDQESQLPPTTKAPISSRINNNTYNKPNYYNQQQHRGADMKFQPQQQHNKQPQPHPQRQQENAKRDQELSEIRARLQQQERQFQERLQQQEQEDKQQQEPATMKQQQQEKKKLRQERAQQLLREQEEASARAHQEKVLREQKQLQQQEQQEDGNADEIDHEEEYGEENEEFFENSEGQEDNLFDENNIDDDYDENDQECFEKEEEEEEAEEDFEQNEDQDEEGDDHDEQQQKEINQNKKNSLQQRAQELSLIQQQDHFADLGVDDWIIRQLSSIGISRPTFIQSLAIPPTLLSSSSSSSPSTSSSSSSSSASMKRGGKGLIGVAETGSGKTAAFAIPILQSLAHDLFGVFAVVMTASRELGYQIVDQFVALGSPLNVRVSIVIGGVNHDKQLEALEKSRPHIVVATPGRLAMMFKTFTQQVKPSFRNTRFVVLDEADRLLENEMETDTMSCLNCLFTDFPKNQKTNKPQLLMYTATASKNLTFPSEVWNLAGVEKNEDVVVVGQPNLLLAAAASSSSSSGSYLDAETSGRGGDAIVAKIPSTISQSVVWVPHVVKLPYLVVALRQHKEKSIIVFTNSCVRCELVRMTLQLLGFPVCSLDSLLNQKQRLESLALFKTGISKILVATDVAARGLDIPAAGLVVHYDFPKLTSVYIHRTGRTGRAGAKGESLAVCTESEKYFLRRLDNRIDAGFFRSNNNGNNNNSSSASAASSSNSHSQGTSRQMTIEEHEQVLSFLDDVSYAKVNAKVHMLDEFGDRIRQHKENATSEESRHSKQERIQTDGGRKAVRRDRGKERY